MAHPPADSSRPNQVSPRRLFLVAVVFALVALVVSLPSHLSPPIEPQAWLNIAFWVGFYVVLSLLNFRTNSFLDTGFQSVAVIVSFLAYGAAAALIVAFAGATIFEGFRYVIRNRFGPVIYRPGEATANAMFEAASSAYATVLAGCVYIILGGDLPVRTLGFPVLALLLVMFVARTVLYFIPFLLVRQLSAAPMNQRNILGWMLQLTLVELIALPLVLLIASNMSYSRYSATWLLISGTFFTALLFRLAANSLQALEKRINELNTLNGVGQALANRRSLPEVMFTIYEQVSHLMDTSSFYIALYNRAQEQIEFAFAMRDGMRQDWEPRKLTNGLTEHIIKTGQPLIIRGTLDETDRQIKALGLRRFGKPSLCYLAVPLVSDKEVLGVISVQSHTDPNAFGPQELALLNTIASQAAATLQNAYLYDSLKELIDKLALLNNVSSLVSDSLDLDKVLNTICTVALEVGSAQKVGIFLASEREATLRLAYSIGLSDDYVAQFDEIVRADDSGPMQVMRQQEPLAMSDVRTDPNGRGWRSLAEVEGYVGLLTVPLIASAKVIGFLATFYETSHQFDKSELDLMGTLANQVAVGVANARLHNDTQARARELSVLVDASRAFTASLDLSSVVEKVFEQLEILAEPDALAIALIKQDGGLEMLVSRRFPTFDTLPVLGGIAEVINTPKALMLPQDNLDRELVRKLDVQSLYTIPLVNQDRAFGVVLIGLKQPRRFRSRERQLIEAMINQASTAIRNAQLFSQVDEELDDRAAELSAIEAISRKISGVLNLDAIITDVLTVALEKTAAELAGFILIGSSPDHMTMVERRAGVGNTPMIRLMEREIGIVGRVLRTGDIARVSDVRLDQDYFEGVPGALSELCVPIVHEGQRVGAINLESFELDHFTASHERFMINLAEHAAIAIGNAKIFEERQRQIETLIKLRNLSLELLSAASLKQVMNLIVEYTLIITHARDVHLYIYDPFSDHLKFGASLWLDGREDVEATPPSYGGRTHQVARTGQMHLIPDTSDLEPRRHYGSSSHMGAVARIPLKRGGRVLGVLIIAYRDSMYFNDNDIRILDLIAGQSAIALENARLFEQVRTGRDRMQVILNSARDGMILIDERGGLALANAAAEQLLGYPLHVFEGHNILRVVARAKYELKGIPNLDFWKKQVHDLLMAIKRSPRDATRREYQIMGGNKDRDIDEMTLPVLDEVGNLAGRLIVLRDATEEHELRRFQDEVADMLIHDLRSPLSGVISSLKLIEDMIASKEYEDIDQVIEIALSSSENQMRMINSLMDIRKWKTGRMPLTRVECSITNIAESALAALRPVASEAEIRLSNLVPEDFPPLFVDVDTISRVMFNLIDNALRHTPNGGEVRIEATYADLDIINDTNNGTNTPTMALISVTDTGKGIPPEARERIFEMFVQVPKSAVRGHRGSGLGLTFCRLTIEAHGGHIWVDSGPEGGASFKFTLPIIRTTERAKEPA